MQEISECIALKLLQLGRATHCVAGHDIVPRATLIVASSPALIAG
jgi:hypothetical protein